MGEFINPERIQVRDESKREIECRIVPWDTVVETADGLEMFRNGAFEDIDPASVVLRMDHADPAGGRGVSLEQRDDGAYMILRAAKTPRGDEILAAASDPESGYSAVSIGFKAGQFEKAKQDGRDVTAHTRVAKLAEVSPTWRPAYESAAILAVRNEVEPMAEATEPVEAPVAPAPVDMTALLERFDAMEERNRKDAVKEMIGGPDSAKPHRRLVIDPSVLRERAAFADVKTVDNLGVVQDVATSEMIGIIDATRPFLESTRQLPTPSSGMNLVVPKITQRPLVGKQSAEKADIASQKTIITSVEFPFETWAGGADVSIQLIKRSSPEFLPLFYELLGEEYAIKTENAAVDNLLAAAVEAGSADFDPLTGDISFGEAFTNAQAVSPRLFPDTIWLSTAAVAAMIDAKTDGTNQPLYSNLALSADANGGISGSVSGLRAVHVPALDDEAVDAIVGPRRGFAWAEDGTYRLTADVPLKAGQDVAIVGMIAFAAWYPGAFTTYALGS